jgi:GWxTD domain-containing protein
MKTSKIFTLLIFLLFISYSSRAITTYFNYARFYSPADGNYLETYLTVSGKSAKYFKNANGKFQSGAEIAWIFYQNDVIIEAKKYILNSSEVDDSLFMPDYTDVQRFVLAPGEYDLEIIVADKSLPAKQFNSKTKIIIEKINETISIADLELLESVSKSEKQSNITKGGFDMTPFQSNFYSNEFEKILFYSEVYNASKSLGDNEKFIVTYSVQDYNSNNTLLEFSGYSKQTAKSVNSFLGELNISNLKSGNYNILVEARDKNNLLVASTKSFFQRQKNIVKDTLNVAIVQQSDYLQTGDAAFATKIKSKDSLVYYIRTFKPISSQQEGEFADRLTKDKDELQMRNYITSFWEKRNPKNPEFEFHKYNNLVNECNAMFSSSQMKGYRTDRGRVYLKYGIPDQRGRFENEPSNFPYEIWQYYTINKVHNRKFVFYNPTLATGAYRLLHSDAIGETRNDNWRVELDSRSQNGLKNRMDLDRTNGNSYMGNSVDENFENPR